MKLCIIEGCGKPLIARGYCHVHYKRWQLYKITDLPPKLPRKPVFELLIDKNSQNELIKYQCWNWEKKISRSGYGQVSYKEKYWPAHRAAYYYKYGDFDNSLFVCHHCDNKWCYNPLHLYLGTRKQNSHDASIRGLYNGGKGENNTMSKLSDADVYKIKQMINNGVSNSEIGRLFGVIHQTISLIKLGKTWTHIKGR